MYFLIFIIIVIIIIVGLLYLYWMNNNEPQNINTGCLYKRYGCCKDKLTPKLDQFGSNCRGF